MHMGDIIQKNYRHIKRSFKYDIASAMIRVHRDYKIIEQTQTDFNEFISGKGFFGLNTLAITRMSLREERVGF